MRYSLLLGGMALVMAFPPMAGAQPATPEQVISVPEVEVRSGPSPKYYATGKLRQGQRVQVVKDKEVDGYLAIVPPIGSFSWINARFCDSHGNTATVLGEHVPVLIGSSLTSAKPTVQQAYLDRGTQVVIVGDSHTEEDGRWLMIQPPYPKEVRYIPREAVQAAPTVDATLTARTTSLSSSGFPTAPASGGAPPASTDPLWAPAQQAEQAGDVVRAKELYTTLARSTSDHNLTILCYNRIRFLDDGNRGSTPRGYQGGVPSVASYGDNRLVPTPNAYGQPAAVPGGNRAVSQYCYVKDSPTAAPPAQTTAYTPRAVAPPPPPVAPVVAPSQPSGPGRLYRASFFVDGKQAYVLETSQGQPRLYLTALPGLNLEPFVNRVVNLYGTVVYRGDLRTNYMTVAQVTPMQ